MKKGSIILVVVFGLAVIYLIAAPYITVYQMKAAAEQHDGEALSEQIDFDSLRQSLKDQFNVMLAKNMAQDEDLKDSPLAALGAAFAGKMVECLLDSFVTPAGITQLMAGEKMDVDQAGEAPSGVDDDEAPHRQPFSDASMSYASLNKFVVKVKSDDGEQEAQFVLRRRGIGWKLTEIVLPLDSM